MCKRQVHREPKLRAVIKGICQKVKNLPLDDLLGERVKSPGRMEGFFGAWR